jgi:hypothetical protein
MRERCTVTSPLCEQRGDALPGDDVTIAAADAALRDW